MIPAGLRKLSHKTGTFLLLLLLFSNGTSPAFGQDAELFKESAKKSYASAKQHFTTNQSSFDAAWQFARACFDWAEFASGDSERENIANEGIAAAHRAIKLKPDSAAGHHYLALNSGQLARTKTLGALRLVKDMEREFKTAAELDPQFDHAGPDRSLGMLYFEAPGWPTSIGSKSKARAHFKRALELLPDFPDNHLSYMEALLSWEEKSDLRQAIKKYRSILPKAKDSYTGDQWKAAWADWERRWQKILDAAENLP